MSTTPYLTSLKINKDSQKVMLNHKFDSVKQVLLGDVGTGKSSIVLRFVKGQFVEFQATFTRAKKWVQELKPKALVMAMLAKPDD
ncbi:hypothetical protein HPP92_018653 [Vanilla planifolia]|uniref:Uncharacterized protein n=1 Tax=Vanilla planifolia TaxID=51239 RepID=A0A835QDZ5_VANPL|nr:hypothetical protein HPP92_018653 [Vanilla planifolia]